MPQKYIYSVKILYLLIGFLLLPYYIHQINSDPISYISIAFRYINQDYWHAISGGWAPMISWMLIPFLLIKINPPAAFLTINLLAGFASLFVFEKLLTHLGITEKIKLIGFSICSVLMLYFALTLLSPDLLVLFPIITYFYFLLKKNYELSYRDAVLCGVLGALGYFCKSYFFGFFCLHFTIYNLLSFFCIKNKSGKKIIANYLLGILSFLFISSFWITALSIKFGKIKISNAAAYNHAIVAPGLEDKYSIEREGLIPPDDSVATSAFETFDDMSHYHRMQDWSPFTSGANFLHQGKIVAKNFYLTCAKLEVLNPLSIVIVLFIIIEGVRKKKISTLVSSYEFNILLFIGLYISGYLLLRIQERYLWIIHLCILLFSLHLVNGIFKKDFSKKIKTISLFLLITSFTIPPVVKTAAMFNSGKDIFTMSQWLKEKNIKGNIASNSNYTISLILSYNLRCKYFGIPLTISDSTAMNELKKCNIDYILWWDNTEVPSFLNSYSEITYGSVIGLKIFHLK